MSSFKRCSKVAMLLALLLAAVLLASCVSFDKSSIDDIPPLNFSEDDIVDIDESEPPTEDGYTVRPTVTAIVNTSPEIVVISGACEEGAVVTATSPVDKVSVKSLNGYYILEYDLDGRDSRSLSITATVDGKKESTARDITITRDAMAETRNDQYEVVLGKDGYLFFRASVDNYCGDTLATVSGVNNFINSVNTQIAALEKRAAGQDVEVIYVLLPNAANYYSEFLPEYAAKDRYNTLYDQLVKGLDGSDATLIDMKPVFEAHKDDGYLLFNKTDSHMTDYAGYLVYTELMTYISEKFPEAAPHGLDQFEISKETVFTGGDLATYGQFDTDTLLEKRVTLTPKFSLDLGDSVHRLKLTTTNISKLQKYAAEDSCAIINGAAAEGNISILDRLVFCTDREQLPSAMIYRDTGSAIFTDYLLERFNNCMLAQSGDYVVNLTDAARHNTVSSDPANKKSVVDYIIVMVDENNLHELVNRD